MTRDDFLRMAREAHRELVTKDYPGHAGQLDPWTMRLLERFAALVAAEKDKQIYAICELALRTGVTTEREACARVCEDVASRDYDYLATDCAAAIRARGEK